MTDTTSDAMGVIVPLIGLGIVANVANNMTRQPVRTRTVTRTRYVTAPKKGKPKRRTKVKTTIRTTTSSPKWLY